MAKTSEELSRRMVAAMGKPNAAAGAGDVVVAGQAVDQPPQLMVATKLQEALDVAFTRIESTQAQQSISERMLGLFEEIIAEMKPARK